MTNILRQISYPVLSVGSIFAGGSGKTPFTIYLAREVLHLGRKPLVLSRGYGRKSSDAVLIHPERMFHMNWKKCGDEPLWIAFRTGVPVAVHRNRWKAFELAQKHVSFDIILLDDGFQHRQFPRDLDIVLLDGHSWSKHRMLIPFGWRREPWKALKRADIFMLSKTTTEQESDIIHFLVNKKKIDHPFFHLDFSFETLLDFTGTEIHKEDIPSRKAIVVASIAHFEPFLHMVRDAGFEPIHIWKRRDHAPWTSSHLKKLLSLYRSHSDSIILTTGKDWVKLREFNCEIPMYVLVQSASVREKQAFRETITPFLNLTSSE